MQGNVANGLPHNDSNTKAPRIYEARDKTVTISSKRKPITADFVPVTSVENNINGNIKDDSIDKEESVKEEDNQTGSKEVK